MGKVNSKQKALNAVKLDEDKELKDLLRENLELKDSYINRGETNTALCMTAYYGSQRCANLLLESGNDVNIPDKQVGLTPLMIASKKNYPNLVDLFLFHGADPKMKCSRGLNALDYAIVHGNYLISYNFTTKEILTPEKTLEEYLKINRQFSFPLFNLPLFYQTLMSKVEPDKTPTFCLTFDKRKSISFINFMQNSKEKSLIQMKHGGTSLVV